MEEMVSHYEINKLITFRYVTLTVSVAILVANFGTSIVSPGLQSIAKQYGVSLEVGILAISLYLVGFGMCLGVSHR